MEPSIYQIKRRLAERADAVTTDPPALDDIFTFATDLQIFDPGWLLGTCALVERLYAAEWNMMFVYAFTPYSYYVSGSALETC